MSGDNHNQADTLPRFLREMGAATKRARAIGQGRASAVTKAFADARKARGEVSS